MICDQSSIIMNGGVTMNHESCFNYQIHYSEISLASLDTQQGEHGKQMLLRFFAPDLAVHQIP